MSPRDAGPFYLDAGGTRTREGASVKRTRSGRSEPAGRRQATEAGADLRSKYADVPPPLPFGFYEPVSPRDAGSFLLDAGEALSCGGIDPVYIVYQLI